MNKRCIVLICLIGFIFGSVIGCGTMTYADSFHFSEVDSQTIWDIVFKDTLYDFVDDGTGVHYLMFQGSEGVTAICPRYNADGSLMVDEKDSEENTEVGK